VTQGFSKPAEPVQALLVLAPSGEISSDVQLVCELVELLSRQWQFLQTSLQLNGCSPPPCPVLRKTREFLCLHVRLTADFEDGRAFVAVR